MDLESRSKNDVPTLESVYANIVKLKRKIHDKAVIIIRNTIGDIKGLSEFQIYMKFKLIVINLDGHIRPEESSWPMVLLEFFMPHSIDWSEKSRLDKIFEFQDLIMEIEGYLNDNESIESDIEDEES